MTPANLSIGLAFLSGGLTVLSPCVLPILPLLLGRSLKSHLLGPLVLVTGLVGGFALTGSLLGFTASWLSEFTNFLRSAAIALLLGLGVLAIFPNWSYRLLSLLPFRNWVKGSTPLGLMGEFWLGTQLGLLWTPCAGPVLGSIFVLAAVNQQVMGAFGLLVVFGIGASLPLLAIAYSGRAFSHHLLKLRPHSVFVQRLGGVIIVLGAIAILLGWDVQIQLWLAPLFPTPSL
jgi:cytochrome c-type biogenesis protein